MMKKRLLSLSLSTLLLLSVFVLPASAEGLPFADVPEDYYAAEAIQYVYENGLMTGTGENTFSPYMPYTRAQFVTMLGRLEGIDADAYSGSQFKDVPADHWAAASIQWASQNNIVNGVGNGMFKPNDVITVEQYCTIVCRYMDSRGLDFPGAPVWTPEIADAGEISNWALPSVVNMVYYNLIGLTRDNYFIPKGEMDRTDIAIAFAALHTMLDQGVCPEAVYDPGSLDVLDEADLIAITRNAASYLGNWFYFNSYTNASDTVDNNGTVFERVVNPYVSSTQQLAALGEQYYDFDVTQVMADVKQTLEQDNSLYLSTPEGLGGFIADRAHIDIDQTGDGSYALQFSYYAGGELLSTAETVLHYNGSRWVFTDLVYVDLAAIDIDVAWG